MTFLTYYYRLDQHATAGHFQRELPCPTHLLLLAKWVASSLYNYVHYHFLLHIVATIWI